MSTSDEQIPTMTLRELREHVGMTQEQVAGCANISQSEVSKMERRTDHKVSTLRRLVEAMGGELEVVARFDRRGGVVDFRLY